MGASVATDMIQVSKVDSQVSVEEVLSYPVIHGITWFIYIPVPSILPWETFRQNAANEARLS